MRLRENILAFRAGHAMKQDLPQLLDRGNFLLGLHFERVLRYWSALYKALDQLGTELMHREVQMATCQVDIHGYGVLA